MDWHSAKGGHKLPNLHKRVKFEGRIKGFSAEWENFIQGYFLKHFPWGKVAKNCQKFYTSASFETFARFTKKYISEVISFNSRARIGYNTAHSQGQGLTDKILKKLFFRFLNSSIHVRYCDKISSKNINRKYA